MICWWYLFFHATAAKAPVKPLDTTSGIDHLLLARVKWMALRTDLQVDILTHCRFRLDHVATATGGGNLFVFRMDACFHLLDLLLIKCDGE